MKLTLACLFFILRITQHVSAEKSTSFVFNGFHGNNISLSGAAGLDNRLIKLTNSTSRQIGRAFYTSLVHLKDSNVLVTSSFSTTFVFCISPMDPILGGHGMAFVMAPTQGLDGAFASQYLGLLNSSNDNRSYNHLFAVEFDTVQDLEFGDIDDNHVGVNINSMRSTYAEKAGYWTTQINASHERSKTVISLKSEEIIQAWIEYDGHNQVLNVSIARVGSPHPSIPLLSVSLDLLNVFEEQMYVGFTASTGVIFGTHRLLAWSFNSDGEAPALDLSLLPSVFPAPSIYSTSRFKLGISITVVILFLGVCTLVGLGLYMRSQREVVEDWELEFGLHRYGYKELRKATKNFSDKELLGVGGFGRVYRGVLPESGVEMAVKRLSRGSDQGEREFIAEMASTGRLRHRNLVQLWGWSRCRGELLLVYEYLPNRSLDKVLHGDSGKVLRWEQRHKILKGIAAGLHYLHEGWEQQVLHRDIKSSNVLLDADMNAKVGDFGLARLFERGENPHTTRVVGTLGYLAPEFARTGKANTSTDVYSFGILLLEIVAGRHPIEHRVSVEDFLLVDRVLDLYMKGRFLEIVDRRLDGLFNEEEMKKVIELGLLCVHPDPLRRPSMQQAVQVLMYRASLPIADLGAPENAKHSTAYSFPTSSGSQSWESVDSSTHLSGR
ncbi:hypothetical protein GOP47_0006760 [Adiantum capillus-veneris]|uniref:non-specific serine/threonine protein kinase n=1 Tax=Adiantum capillus-veneris TaxID=13818 RepID=A0A9D4ZKQ9_ADICA|nr:hypothetical protein GOP47_0006760 [Adiantum capillus-veneris]